MSSEMDFGIRRYNDRSRDYYMGYPNYFRHGTFQHALPAPNFCYAPGNECFPYMGINHFPKASYIFNEPSNKQIKQKFNTSLENPSEITKVNMQKEKVVMASTKDKTPMCLVNEISRFNKIEQKYILTNEEGPAHKKVFFVSLMLGDEKFSSSGRSIKKARHAVAVEALKSTSYPRPQNKLSQTAQNVEVSSGLTPTVELNSLAMKRGQSASYEVVGGHKGKPPASGKVSFNKIRGHNPAFIVKVSIEGKEFHGDGYSKKSARHAAAREALSSLRSEDDPPQKSNGKVATSEESTVSTEEKEMRSGRSEVSKVNEIALKRGFASATFQITAETGSAHMRTYTTTCSCGHLVATGEGNSKKASKQRSAEKMLEELNKLPPISESETNKPQNKLNKSRCADQSRQNYTPAPHANEHITLLKAGPDFGAGINPVSRLIQIQQAKKLPEPSFALLEERGVNRDKEFHMQVSVADKSCSSWAQSKKLAKRNAAEQMLHLLGYSNGAFANQARPKTSEKTTNNVSLETDNINEGNTGS